jgi:hypothetical protein
MQWEKKICIRLTARRIVGAVLTASTVVNLVIVGAAFEAAAPTAEHTVTSLLTTPLGTVITLVSTTTVSETSTHTLMPSATFTPTDMLTDPPTLSLCILSTYWPVYRVQLGDTLFSLARLTGSTADELRLANCLPDYQIFTGQLLYVARLPIKTITPSFTATETPTVTSTDTSMPTPTDTPSPTPTTTPTNPPTVFQNPDGYIWFCPNPDNIYFSAIPDDPQGLSSLIALYKINSGSWVEASMQPDGDTYYGSGSLAGKYSINDTVTYYFRAIDSFRSITDSTEYSARLQFCSPG